MRATFRILPFLISLSAILGCATGQKFTFDQVGQVQLGMTESQVLEILPPPGTKRTNPDGTEGWVWRYSDLAGSRWASIVFKNGVVTSVPEELESVRRAYVDSHPDLDSIDKSLVLSGSLSLSDAESRRVKLAKEKAEEQKRDAENEAAVKQAREAAKKARQDFIAREDVSQRIRDAVATREVVIGMTAEQVKLSWGEPRSVTSTVTTRGTSELWFYSNRDTTLTFADGILQSWTTTSTR